MTKLNDLRIVNDFEKSIIANSLSKISQNTENLIQEILNSLYISFDRINSKGQHPSVFLVSKNSSKIIKKFETRAQITSIALVHGTFNLERPQVLALIP